MNDQHKAYLTTEDENLMERLVAASAAYKAAYQACEEHAAKMSSRDDLDDDGFPADFDEWYQWSERNTQLARTKKDMHTALTNAAQDVASMWVSRQLPF
jgi:hypothetical protein